MLVKVHRTDGEVEEHHKEGEELADFLANYETDVEIYRFEVIEEE